MKSFLLFIGIVAVLIIATVTVKTAQRRTTLPASQIGSPSVPQLVNTYATVLAGWVTIPTWSPTGEVFAGYQAGDVVVYNLASKELARFPETDSFSWSPDGKYIAGAMGLPPNQVFIAKSHGTELRTLATLPGNIRHVAWASPDAIFISYRKENDTTSMLSRISTKDGSVIKISEVDEVFRISPGLDGDIVFVRGAKENKIDEIVKASSNGRNLAVLAKIPHEYVNGFDGMTWGPLLSPNGRWLASVGADPQDQDKNETWLNIIDLNQTNGSVQRLMKVSEALFAWSPDSQEIAVTANVGSNKKGALVVANVVNGATRILAMPDSDRCTIWQPAWNTEGLLALHQCTSDEGDPTGPLQIHFYKLNK